MDRLPYTWVMASMDFDGLGDFGHSHGVLRFANRGGGLDSHTKQNGFAVGNFGFLSPVQFRAVQLQKSLFFRKEDSLESLADSQR